MFYVGLDLHKRYVTGCVVDSQGAVVAEQRRLSPVLETVLGWLAPLGQPVAVALEATLYWAWLHDRLAAAGYQVTVAHPQQVKIDLSRAMQDGSGRRPQARGPAADRPAPRDLDSRRGDAGAADAAAGARLAGPVRTRVKARIQAYLAPAGVRSRSRMAIR